MAVEPAYPKRRCWLPGPAAAADLMLVLDGQASWAVDRRPAIHQEPSPITPADDGCHTDGAPMSGREEHADTHRGGFGTFPRSWGIPPGERDSEERAAWVKENVMTHQRIRVYKRILKLKKRIQGPDQ